MRTYVSRNPIVPVVMTILVSWWWSVPVCAQSATAPTLKAVFLYNFAKFTEWPLNEVSAGVPLVFCVVGDPAVAQSLEAAARGQALGGHPLVVRRMKAGDAVRSCQLLYAGGVDAKHAVELLDAVKDAAILTVSDLVGFAQIGGTVQLFVEDGRMRFAINVDAAERCKLRLSAQLLNLAKLIKDDPNVVSR